MTEGKHYQQNCFESMKAEDSVTNRIKSLAFWKRIPSEDLEKWDIEITNPQNEYYVSQKVFDLLKLHKRFRFQKLHAVMPSETDKALMQRGLTNIYYATKSLRNASAYLQWKGIEYSKDTINVMIQERRPYNFLQQDIDELYNKGKITKEQMTALKTIIDSRQLGLQNAFFRLLDEIRYYIQELP